MKNINFPLITSDSIKAPGTKAVFGAMQDFYKDYVKSVILGNIGVYDPTKVYVFGGQGATYVKSTGNNIFTNGTNSKAYYNGNVYSLVDSITCNDTGNKLGITTVNTSIEFSDGVNRDFITEYKIVQDNATGTIEGSNIVPLFVFEKKTAPQKITSTISVWRDGNNLCITHYPVSVTGNVVFNIDLEDYGGDYIDRISTGGDSVGFLAFVNNLPVKASCSFNGTAQYTITIPVTGTQIVECDAKISIFTGYF